MTMKIHGGPKVCKCFDKRPVVTSVNVTMVANGKRNRKIYP